MKKGVVFSIDMVFALYVTLLFSAALVVVLTQSQSSSIDVLDLSRIADDMQNIKQFDSSAAFPSSLVFDSNCDGKQLVGSAVSFKYNANAGYVEEFYQRVCYK